MTTPEKPKFSIRKLASQTGHDRASIARWTAGAADETEALARIREHEGDAKFDPATGLSWYQAKQREAALAARRANAEAERRASEAWLPVETHQEIIAQLVTRLDQLPAKLLSEAGLTPAQATALQRALDQAREEAHAAILTMAHKKQNQTDETEAE